MKKMLVVSAVCALLAGCDYTVPLVETAGMPIDVGVVGLWQRVDADNNSERLLVLPLNEREYLVVYPAESKEALFACGSLWRNEGFTLVQLDWFGTAQGKLPEDRRTFQYADYSLEADKLTLRLLNPEAVTRDAASTAALSAAIAANLKNPQLFRAAMVFSKVKPRKEFGH